MKYTLPVLKYLPCSSLSLVSAASLLLLGVSHVQAVTQTWTTGAGTTDWSNASNWNAAKPVSGDSVTFGTTTGATTLNDDITSSAFSLNVILFTAGANSYTFGGNDFASAAGGKIQNDSGVLQTINNNINFLTGVHTVSSGTVVLGGTISGLGSLSVSSSVVLSLTGAGNSYSGGTTLGAATVKVGNSSVFGSGTITLGSATLDNISGSGLTAINNAITTSGNVTVTYAGSANNLTLGGNYSSGGNNTFTVNGNTLILSGTISETGGVRNLTKTGAATLALNGVNTYSGTTTVSTGTLSTNNLANIGSASGIGKGDATSTASNQASLIINGAALLYTGATGTTDRLFTLGAGTSTIDASGIGAITFSNTNSILSSTNTARTLALSGTNTGDNTFASAWVNAQGVGANALTKNGTGKWILSGANTYTGNTAVNAGILQFAKVTSLYGGTAASWTAAHITVASGATLALNVGGSGEFTSSDVDTIKAIGTAANGLRSGATLGFDTTNATSGTFTYASSIANTNGGTNVIGLTKLGTNTLNLTGSNSYTGVTTVAAGTLLVNGSISGGGAVNVNAGRLGGAGTITGAVTVGDGAGGSDSFIAPGNSPGTLNTGNLTLNSDATFSFELNSTSLQADQINVTGTVNLLAGAQFSFTDLGSGTITLGTVFTLINNDSGDGITGVFGNLANGSTFTNNGNTYQVNYAGGTGGNDLVLTVVVPEPSTTILVGLGLVAAIRMVRRRQAN